MKRNGKIELLRFIFCMGVLFFHIDKYLLHAPVYNLGPIRLSFFHHGAMGVEFFFLVSGFFMARSVYRQLSAGNIDLADKAIAKNSLMFMKKKYFSIFPQHLVAFAISFVAYTLLNKTGVISTVLNLFKSIPNIFLFQMSGAMLKNPNHLEWYISAMLLVMAIIYPILLKHYYKYTRYIGPVIALFLLGFCQATTNKLTGVYDWSGIAYKSMLRAFAEITLGTTAFEISRAISKIEFSKAKKWLFTVIEIVFLGVSLFYIISTVKASFEIIELALLFVVVIIVMSPITIKPDICDNKFCYFLGSYSLPIYLAQCAAIYLCEAYFMEQRMIIKIAVCCAFTAVFAVIVKLLGDLLKKKVFDKI